MLLVILPRNQITMRFETVTCVWFLLAANVLHAIESNAWVLIAGRYFQLQPGPQLPGEAPQAQYRIGIKGKRTKEVL